MPAPQLETENCVAHNGSIIPVPGRDIFVQAWYQGGISIVDFTDSENPFEIAYFDRGPVLEDELITGGYWSVYYYEGNIYATEITRGLDVFKLLPSEHMTANEIAAAASAYPRTGPKRSFNPQHQVPMIWMPDPLLAKSYVDQLIRNNVIDGSLAEMLLKVLTQIDSSTNKSNNKRLIKQLNKITESLELTTDAKAIDTNRLNELIIALESIKLGIS